MLDIIVASFCFGFAVGCLVAIYCVGLVGKKYNNIIIKNLRKYYA